MLHQLLLVIIAGDSRRRLHARRCLRSLDRWALRPVSDPHPRSHPLPCCIWWSSSSSGGRASPIAPIIPMEAPIAAPIANTRRIIYYDDRGSYSTPNGNPAEHRPLNEPGPVRWK